MASSELAGKRVTVMGLGRFGGGLGVARWLAAQGADVLVTDLDPPDRLAESVNALRDLVDAAAVTLRLGGHNVSDFTTCDLVVANPAVPHPWDNRFLRSAQAAKIPITTEIALTIERLPDRARVIGVTGSAGKSTTSALVHHILVRAGQPARLAGNIGRSLLPELAGLDPRTWIVLELSSFQLYWLGGGPERDFGGPVGPRAPALRLAGGEAPEPPALPPRWSPRVAVVTNLASNHLDWHGTLEHYRASKQVLLASQRAGDAAVLGPGVADWPVREGVRRVLVPENARAPGLTIPGRHNETNAAMAAAAVAALDILGLDADRALELARDFPGLPHRLEFVGAIPLAGGGAARAFNDSKSTTPEATLLALDSFAGRVHLIAGGYDKKADLSPIARRAAGLAGFYTIGITGPGLAKLARELGATAARDVGTLERAIDAAWPHLREGDVLLLSPGCASWDQFINYERRGERFVELLRARGAREPGA